MLIFLLLVGVGSFVGGFMLHDKLKLKFDSLKAKL